MSAGRIGWAAAKANAVPMVVLWCLAAATVAAYYLVPGVAAAFEPQMAEKNSRTSMSAMSVEA